MPALPTWLTALQRVREHHRDAALQSLALNLRAATTIRDDTSAAMEVVSRIRNAQQLRSQAGPLDAERLRQLRQDREDFQSRLAKLQDRQVDADNLVQEAQSVAVSKESAVEILKRLEDRLLTAHRHKQRLRQDQSSLEASLSLCNGGFGG